MSAAREYAVEAGWLVELTAECSGGACGVYGHEPSCGMQPLGKVDDLLVAAVAVGLLRKVRDYWDGRPTTHHGDHIYTDLCDVLRAIEPAGEQA